MDSIFNPRLFFPLGRELVKRYLYKSHKGGSCNERIILSDQHVFLRTQDRAVNLFKEAHDVWCAHIPKISHGLFLCDTWPWPEAERLIMPGEFQLPSETRFDVFSEQAALEFPISESSNHIIFSPCLEEHPFSFKDCKAIQSKMFLILVQMT